MMNATSSTLPPSTSLLDFLIDARIPALDGHLSPDSQSMLLELLFWCAAYLIYAEVFSEIVRSALSKMNFWQKAVKTKVGVFCWNGQDDVVLLVVLGVHHLVAGCMCALGVRNGDANMWRHGFLLEIAFELGDILAFVGSIYPHRHENLKPDAVAGLFFHHLPGIVSCGLILHAGLHHNEHVREIALWLLLGAFFSCAGAVYIHLQDLDTQMKQATGSLIFFMAFWVYSRFYIFPKEAFLVLQDVEDDPALKNDALLVTFLNAYGCLMSIFNTLILADGIPKTYLYVLRTMDGVTKVETKAVPLSREDRWKQGALKKML